MRLSLIHGRSHRCERLEGWGFDGPTLDGVAWVTMTYLSTLRVGFVDAAAAGAAQHLTGWETTDELILEARIEEDLIHVPASLTPSGGTGGWFADWSVDSNVNSLVEMLPQLLGGLPAGERTDLFRRLGAALRSHAPEAADALEFHVER